MGQKLGALLCIALGGVLIFSGINGSGAGAVGVLPAQCGGASDVGVANPGTCPTGTITLTELTVLTANPTATAPEGWQVSVTSVGDTPCNLPETGTTQTVPNNGGPVSFDNLFIFQDTTTDTYCQYALTETPVAGYSSAFAPAAPYSFVYLQPRTKTTSGVRVQPHVQAPSPIAVVLTNTAAAPTTTTPTKTVTTTPTPTRTVTSSASTSSSASSSPVTTSTSRSNSVSPTTASTSPALANTGPNRPVRPSLYIGVGLVLLGLVLLVAGRRRPRGEHA